MEPEGSLPQSQLPGTCLYPEPAQSSPYHPTSSHFLKFHHNIILPSIPGSPQWYLYLKFPTKTLTRLSLPPSQLHAMPISLIV
jgi:hypothetical protein